MWNWMHHGEEIDLGPLQWSTRLLPYTLCRAGVLASAPLTKCTRGIMALAGNSLHQPLRLIFACCYDSVVNCVYGWMFVFVCKSCMHVFGFAFVWFWFQVLLACRWRVFPGHSIDERLKHAFNSFHTWCKINKKRSSISKFELKTFKMASCLGSISNLWTCIQTCLHACMSVCFIFIWCTKYCHQILMHAYMHVFNLRLQVWPGGCGKAYDTTLLCRWLLHFVVNERMHDGHVAKLKIIIFGSFFFLTS